MLICNPSSAYLSVYINLQVWLSAYSPVGGGDEVTLRRAWLLVSTGMGDRLRRHTASVIPPPSIFGLGM